VTYSLAWHPDQDRLAFSYCWPTEDDGRGPGGIQIAGPDEPPRDVGGSAVREVLHWLPDGPLATRTDENLYVVATADCATEASVVALQGNCSSANAQNRHATERHNVETLNIMGVQETDRSQTAGFSSFSRRHDEIKTA
ncbi:MAG: hypothetical protein BRD39_03890, partial [Bacteroidetes bacterium QH_9_64_21]